MDDFFGKLDDAIYKPIESVCRYITEPLEAVHAKRYRENVEHAAKLANDELILKSKLKRAEDDANNARKIEYEKEMYALEERKRKLAVEIADAEAERERENKREAARLEEETIRANAEINKMLDDEAFAHQEKLVKAIQEYQITLAKTWNEMRESLAMMSLTITKEANNMIEEKVLKYKAMQDQAKKDSLLELQEVKNMFFLDDPETYRLMVETIREERSSIINEAKALIDNLSFQIKQITNAVTESQNQGIEYIQKILLPMTKSLNSNIMIEERKN